MSKPKNIIEAFASWNWVVLSLFLAFMVISFLLGLVLLAKGTGSPAILLLVGLFGSFILWEAMSLKLEMQQADAKAAQNKSTT